MKLRTRELYLDVSTRAGRTDCLIEVRKDKHYGKGFWSDGLISNAAADKLHLSVDTQVRCPCTRTCSDGTYKWIKNVNSL